MPDELHICSTVCLLYATYMYTHVQLSHTYISIQPTYKAVTLFSSLGTLQSQQCIKTHHPAPHDLTSFQACK